MDRERCLLKLKPLHFVERTYGSMDPYSGAWTFERPLFGMGVLVRAVLCLFDGEPARCEQFAIVREGLEATVEPMPLQLAGVAAHKVDVTVDGTAVTAWVSADEDKRTGTLYGTRPQDHADTVRAKNVVRAQRGLPCPEDFSRFSERWLSYRTTEHLNEVLGWPARRWHELEFGALATEVEAAVMRRLKDPTWLFDRLIQRFPKRYSRVIPDCWQTGVVDLRLNGSPSDIIGDGSPDMYSGFALKEVDAISALANELGYWVSPTWEQFWQLMFLCDMKCYRLLGRGLTGIRYQATPIGPTVQDADALMDLLRREHVVCSRGMVALVALPPTAYIQPWILSESGDSASRIDDVWMH